MGVGDLERLLGALGLEHAITATRQEALRDATHRFAILDEEHGLVAARERSRLGGRCRLASPTPESSAGTRVRRTPARASTPPRHRRRPGVTMACTVGRPRPVPRSSALVVKNGSNARCRTSSGMPTPSSRIERQRYVRPGCAGDAGVVGEGRCADERRADAHRADIGDRVAGVDDQVGQHLLDLPRIGEHARQAGQPHHFERDARPEQSPEQRRHPRDDVVELQRLGLHDLAPAEREQLARQVGGLLRRLADSLQFLEHRRVARQQLARGVAVAEHDGEQVAEVVGDAAGESPQRLLFLRLEESGVRGDRRVRPRRRFQVEAQRRPRLRRPGHLPT